MSIHPDRTDYSSVVLLIKSAVSNISIAIDLSNNPRLFLENLIYTGRVDAGRLRNSLYNAYKIIFEKLSSQDATLEVELIRDPEISDYDKVFFCIQSKSI